MGDNGRAASWAAFSKSREHVAAVAEKPVIAPVKLRKRSSLKGRGSIASLYRDLGMVKVRGALGGVYYE